MQRLTKYRVLVAALAVASGVSAGYAFVAHSGAEELRSELASANRSAADSAARAAKADDKLARLEQQVPQGTDEQAKTAMVIAAFSTQAAACEAVKHQLHVKEKQDAHS